MKAGRSTRTKISVTIPAKMLGALGLKSGKPVATRFRVRILARRFRRRFTTTKRSPVIGPAPIALKGDELRRLRQRRRHDPRRRRRRGSRRLTNAFEVARPANWETTYVSTSHDGGATPDPRARVNPFNPCKPFYSSTCHRYPPFDYYQDNEDWASPVRQDGP